MNLPRVFAASIVLALSLAGCAASDLRPDQDEQPEPVPVAVDCPTIEPTVDDSEIRSSAEDAAMPADEFWDYIALLEGQTTEAGFDRLADALAAAGVDAALAFDIRLALSLYELDSLCRADWYSANDPAGLGSVSDDTFLYARCDTIAAGRANWEAAVADNTLPWGDVDPSTGMGEFLLYVGADAAQRLGVPIEEYWDRLYSALPLSYETGSNPNGWPPL